MKMEQIECIIYTHLPTYDVGTDRMFRNVGI